MAVSPNGYTDDFGPNVSKILAGGTRVIRGRVPLQVRKELRAEAYSAHVRDIEEATGDLRVAAVDIAANLGNQFMCDGDRRAIRECDLISDILSDVQSWCDEVREEA